jgi:hypothetical protein
MTITNCLEIDDEWLYSAKTILTLHYNDDIDDDAALRMLQHEIDRERENYRKKIFAEGKKEGVREATFNIGKKKFEKERKNDNK